MEYKLTFWQRIELIFIYPLWLLNWLDPKRKSWHEVKKGMEKHKCNYSIPKIEYHGSRHYRLLQCDHEGCYVCWPLERCRCGQWYDDRDNKKCPICNPKQ